MSDKNKNIDPGYDSSWDEYRDEEMSREGDDRALESDEVRMRRSLDFTRKSVSAGKMSPEDGIRDFLSKFPESEPEPDPYDDLTEEEIMKLFPNPTDEELDDMYKHFIKEDAKAFGIKNIDSVSFEVLEKTVNELSKMEDEGKIVKGQVMIPGMKLMATEEGPKVYPKDWNEPKDYENASEFSSDEELNASYDKMLDDFEK